MAELKVATLIETGETVEVYQSSLFEDVYIDFKDCKTKYHKSELKFSKWN